jgi:hypothetical protein
MRHSLRRVPKLVAFVVKWTFLGVVTGWLIMALLLLTDVGGIGHMMRSSDSGLIALIVMALSFAVTSGPVAVTAAVLLSRDFGAREPTTSRLDRWKAGHSAELERDPPLP